MKKPAHDTPTVEFDHHSAALRQDPVGTYAELRRRCPVFWTESHGGYWVLTRYADVVEALGHPEIYSSARRDDAGGPGSSVSIPKRPGGKQRPLELDPPASTPYRKILSSLLSPAASERMRDALRARVAWCIDQFIERGSADLVEELASAVPGSFTIDWLGLPHESWPMISRTMHSVSAQQPGSAPYMEALTVLRQKMFLGFSEAIADHRERPRGDVISHILRQEINGLPLTDEEALSMVSLIVAGGVDTVTALASQAFVWLSANRDAHRRLLEDDGFLRSATEEFLRMFTPAQALARTVSGDTEMGGCTFTDGDRVLVAYASANRDGGVFDDPHTMVLQRSPNRHLAFGWGVHRCVGANITHVMFEEMVRAVLNRMPDYRVDPAELSPYFSQGLFSGWQSVPVHFTPGPKVGTPLDVRGFRLAPDPTPSRPATVMTPELPTKALNLSPFSRTARPPFDGTLI